jgi:hypothetical protein
MPDRHLRFTLPDPVAVSADREGAPGAWLSHRDAKTSVMMQIPDLGAFVRTLLPVGLTDGSSVTYGVWLSIHPDDLQRAAAVWDEPEYLALELDGVIANAIPPWGLLALPVHTSVRNRRHTPYCDSSPDPTVARVLTDLWPVEDVLGALPS